MRENVSSKLFYNLNHVCRMFLMPLMLVLLFVHNTVVNEWVGGRIITLQNILAIIIMAIFICNFIENPKGKIRKWIKENKLIIIYIIVRIISFYLSEFNYSVIRSIFFELFMITCIKDKLILHDKVVYAKIFMVLQFIFSFFSLGLYYATFFLGQSYIIFLSKTTNYIIWGNALLFGNPNSAGIMAGFGLIIAIILFNEKLCNRKLIILYGVFNVIALILFGCRSAYIGIIIVVCVILTSMILKNNNVIKKFTFASLIGVTVATMLIYGVMIATGGINNIELSSLELKLNSFSSGRYLIWNECAIEQQDSLLFGEGSLKTEQEERKRIFKDTTLELETAAELGPHNGYIGMISATGILGLVLFMAILIDRIRKCKYIDNYWALILIYIFVINCFESLFILNRFFTCFFMFYILASGAEEEE